jgi:hypothetical protein
LRGAPASSSRAPTVARLEKFDVEGILAFAERVLPRASDLWVQASLDQRQRLQEVLFPDGVVFDGNRFVRTGVSSPAFKYLTAVQPTEKNLASLMPASWNQIATWLTTMDELRQNCR